MQILIVSLFIFMTACSTAPVKKSYAPAPPNQAQEIQSIKSLLSNGDTKKAFPRLKKLATFPVESQAQLEAHSLLAKIYIDAQRCADADPHLKAIFDSDTLGETARVQSAECALSNGKKTEAQKTLEPLLKNSSADLRFRIYKNYYESLENPNPMLALAWLSRLSDVAPTRAEKDYYRGRAEELLDSKVTPENLATLSQQQDLGAILPKVKYRYALSLAHKKDFSAAASEFQRVVDLAPNTELSEKSKSFLVQLQARQAVDPVTIGAVLPLSGKQAYIGIKVLRGLQLGLGIYGKNEGRYRLAVVDSEGSTDMARRAIERLVIENHVVGIVGGVLSRTAFVEASQAQALGVPFVGLSQKSGLTQTGDLIFRNALTPEMQIRKLVDLAMNKFGLKRFAVLFPNDAYGIEYTNIFWDEVRSRGGQLVGAQPYSPNETDFRGAVQRLVGKYYVDDRMDEYKLKLKAWQEKNPRRTGRQETPNYEDLVSPITDFDALFIPDGAKSLGQIAAMLTYLDVDLSQIKLLGTNLWNTPATKQRAEKYLSSLLFVDSYLNTDAAFSNSEFVSQFRRVYGEEPGIFELQAYDAGTVMRQALGSGENSRSELASYLARSTFRSAALGPLEPNKDREFIRPIIGLHFTNGDVAPVESSRE